jgi:signal transduction histidine kinase
MFVMPHPLPPTPPAAPPLPRGRTGWAIPAVVAAILALSSVAPFVRFGARGPSVSADDTVSALVYLATWVPFIAVAVAYTAGPGAASRGAGAHWAGHAALLLTLPALHALTFLAVGELARGAPLHALGARALGDIRFQVLTLLGTLQYLVVVAVLWAVLSGRAAERVGRRAAELELAGARLESQLARARVDALRAQLHPHFLFNTLNSISVLTANDPAGARVMVRRLSELLRAVLVDGDRPTVPLRREVELLMAYVDIQRVRFGERLRVTVDVDPAAAELPVPTLVLQPLVENAIRHAVAEREDGGTVAVAARLAGEHLTLTVADDGPGSDGDAPAPGSGRGVGHRNTRERLREMYGPRYAFAVEPRPGGGCAVRLELPVAP